MWNVHPKYLKTEKVRLTQRVANAIVCFVNCIINGVALIFRSFPTALQAFMIRETQVLDREKFLADLEIAEQEQNENDGTLRLDIRGPDDDEEWKKEHNDLYGGN